MAIEITFPKSEIVKPSELSTFMITWESDIDGQVAYELQYKLKKDQTWSTCGKVYSTDQQCKFERIYELCPVEFYEIMYRVAVYYEGPNIDKNSELPGIIHSIQTSDAYWVIFREQEDANFKVAVPSESGMEIHEYPMYDEITPESHELAEVEHVNVNVGTGNTLVKKVLPLVQLDSPMAGKLRVSTPTGIKAGMEFQSHFRPTKQYKYGYVDQYVPIYVPVYTDRYAPYYSHEAVYNYSTVYAYAQKYMYQPVYYGAYDYMQYYATDIYYYEYSYYYKTYNTHTYVHNYSYGYSASENYTYDQSHTGNDKYYVKGYHYRSYTYKYSGPAQYTITYAGAYAYKYDSKGAPYSYATRYYTFRPTVEIEGTGYTKVTDYAPYSYTYYTKETGTYYYPATGYGSSTYTYYTFKEDVFVPSAYAPDYYTIYSYDYSTYAMYLKYYYYQLDYYYTYGINQYFRYIDSYYSYVYAYKTVYLGQYQYYIIDHYDDHSYSYNYTI